MNQTTTAGCIWQVISAEASGPSIAIAHHWQAIIVDGVSDMGNQHEIILLQEDFCITTTVYSCTLSIVNIDEARCSVLYTTSLSIDVEFEWYTVYILSDDSLPMTTEKSTELRSRNLQQKKHLGTARLAATTEEKPFNLKASPQLPFRRWPTKPTRPHSLLMIKYEHQR